jgi:hypothetical protein
MTLSGADQPMPNVTLDITGMKNAAALLQIAHLINASQDALSAAGTDRAFAQLDEPIAGPPHAEHPPTC